MKTLVITGAAGNLGREVLGFFLEKGIRVIAVVLNDAEAAEVRALRGPAENLEVSPLDLTDEAAVEEAARGWIEKFQRIDAAFMLAGGFAGGSIHDTSANLVRRQIALNFETAYPLCRVLFRHMLANSYGRLVLVGSRPALEPAAGKSMLPYALSKSLLFRLAEILNAEARDKDVVTSVIVPSTIDTPANRKDMPQADPGKWVKPLEIAELLYMLCTEKGAPLRETVLKIYGQA